MGWYVISPTSTKLRAEFGAERVTNIHDAYESVRDVAMMQVLMVLWVANRAARTRSGEPELHRR